MTTIKYEAWQQRHQAALENPQGCEIPIVGLFQALDSYIDTYYKRYQQTVFEDGVLFEGVKEIANGLRILLNGETGRLDCGTLDARLGQILRTCGVEI